VLQLFPKAADAFELADCGHVEILVFRPVFSAADKIPLRKLERAAYASAMDVGMSSDCAACFVDEFCGVADFPTAVRAMPHMTRRVATRKRLILASGIRKRIREPRREVERAGS
jgi:hypothetical protein